MINATNLNAILGDSIASQPWFIIVILLVFFGLIVIGVILLKKHSNFFKPKDKKPEEKEIVKEELTRVLEEVQDEDTKKAMEAFDTNKQSEENKTSENKDHK